MDLIITKLPQSARFRDVNKTNYFILEDINGNTFYTGMKISDYLIIRQTVKDMGITVISISSLKKSYNFGTSSIPEYRECFGRARFTTESRLKKIKQKHPELFI